jgi:hypothetical protein
MVEVGLFMHYGKPTEITGGYGLLYALERKMVYCRLATRPETENRRVERRICIEYCYIMLFTYMFVNEGET